MRNKVYFKALGVSSIENLNTKLYPQRTIGKGQKHVRGRGDDRELFWYFVLGENGDERPKDL